MSDGITRRGFARLALGGAVLLGAPGLALAKERSRVAMRLEPYARSYPRTQLSVRLHLTAHGEDPVALPEGLVRGLAALDDPRLSLSLRQREGDLRSRAGPRQRHFPTLLPPQEEVYYGELVGEWPVASGERFETPTRLVLGPATASVAHRRAAALLGTARAHLTLTRPA